MKVMLINPKFRLPIDTRTTPHLGLAYLAAVSERRGDEVFLFDADVEDEHVTDAVRRYQPDVVGITANTPQVKQAWRTAQAIKSIKDVPIVIGGPHPSVIPLESAERPEIDVVARGEGEEIWLAVCEAVEKGLAAKPAFTAHDMLDPQAKHLSHILGITFRTNDGQMHNHPDHPPVADLDSLPWPAYHVFKMDRYTNLQPATDAIEGARSFSVLTSRGCPYRCTFCSQSIMPQKWRARSAESVLAEWRHLVEELGAQEIGVLDDSANIKVDRLMDLADLLIENKLNHVPWIFVNGIRANLASRELLGKLKAAGLKRTAFGVESGDPDILLSIDKKIDHDTIRRAFKNAKEVGLETIGFFIIGLPGETEETMERTIQFAIELDPMIANFSMLTPYPGTAVYEIAKRQGRILVEDWEDYVFFEGKARYEMGEMSAELIERKWRESYRRFYLRPSRVLRIVTRKDFWINWRRTFRMAFRTLFPREEKTELKKAVEASV
ncbi:MAG: cobalamin-dependent protein [Anaerolineales bacterium]|nr:MAG: cobalamin-dependent protein [Anaerolineales bacterium]